MKYRLEHWWYSGFDMAEMEEHLNVLAAKGWELCWIDEGMFPLACYRKTKDAKNRQYTVDAVEWDAEDYLFYCEDAGWKLLYRTTSDLCFFYGKRGAARPLYSDNLSRLKRYRQIQKMPAGNYRTLTFMQLFFFSACCFNGNMLREARQSWLFFTALAAWAVIAIFYLVNIRMQKRMEQAVLEGRQVENPQWLHRMNRIAAGFAASILVVVSIGGMLYFSVWNYHIVSLILFLIGQILFWSGIVVHGASKKDDVKMTARLLSGLGEFGCVALLLFGMLK